MNGIAATSWGKARIDLFWRGQDGALWTRHWDLGGWSADLSLGGTPASAPAVVSWAVGQMEVFAVFPDGQLWDRYFDGSDWHPWESLGGELATDATPRAAAGAPNAWTCSHRAGTGSSGIAGGTAPAGSTGSSSRPAVDPPADIPGIATTG